MSLTSLSVPKLKTRLKLKDYESALLDVFLCGLRAEIRDQIYGQLNTFNKIQRIDNGKEIDFYNLKRGKATFVEEFRLETEEQELLASKIEVKSRIYAEAKIWIIRGYLFSIEIDTSPHLIFEEGTKDAVFEVKFIDALLKL
jgi:hypothetical protein